MKILKDQQGIALLTALMLTLISMTVIMYLTYMLTSSTKLSGANKRYKTALSASYGGAEILAKDIIPVMFGNISTPATAIKNIDTSNKLNMLLVSDQILRKKIMTPSAQWPDAASKSFDPTTAPDVTMTLNSTTSDPFTVYTKIVETNCSDPRPYPKGMCTGSDLSGYDEDNGLVAASVAESRTGGNSVVSPQSRPAQYRIEVRSQRSNNPKERSNLSILYAY